MLSTLITIFCTAEISSRSHIVEPIKSQRDLVACVFARRDTGPDGPDGPPGVARGGSYTVKHFSTLLISK